MQSPVKMITRSFTGALLSIACFAANAEVTASHDRDYVGIALIAGRAGRLQVPAPGSGVGTTSPLAVKVAANALDQSLSQHVFLTTKLGQTQPYVHGNVIMTVSVHSDVPMRQAALSFDGTSDVAVQQVGEAEQDAEVIGNRRYQVIHRRYALQMQRSGSVTLRGPTLDAQIEEGGRRDRFGEMLGLGSLRQLRLHGNDIKLEVSPLPFGATSQDWLPAEKLNLEKSWRPEGASLRAGEPLILRLRIDALGLTAGQLPDLGAQLRLPAGIKAYPDQPKLETSMKGSRISSSREQDIALIATRAGSFRIQELKLNWWDTTTFAAQEIVLPERVFEVQPSVSTTVQPSSALPATAAAAAPQPLTLASRSVATVSPAQNSAWSRISLVVALLWIATLVMWAVTERAQPIRIPEPEKPKVSNRSVSTVAIRTARKAFQQACRDANPVVARRALLDWARHACADPTPAGLNAFAARLDDPQLTPILRELDRACYSGGQWNGDLLAKALMQLPERFIGNNPNQHGLAKRY